MKALENIRLLNKLIEIEINIELEKTEEIVEKLKLQYNTILLNLKKAFRFEYNNPQDVIDFMIKHMKYPNDFAISKSRKRETYVYPRQIAQTISKDLFRNKSLADIGSYFSNSDHASVLHSISNVKTLLISNKEFRSTFNKIQIEMFGFEKIKYNDL